MSIPFCLLSASIALVTLGCSNCFPQEIQPSLRIPQRGIGFDWGVFYSQVQVSQVRMFMFKSIRKESFALNYQCPLYFSPFTSNLA